ncbi:MAG TPA: hypothetical protein VMB78_02760 [Dissulfurispiraceae bacterium]|nr:hypothetical protein [Dissulfurispiraceae bacterium]
MKKTLIVTICLMFSFFMAGSAVADDTYYARCNIKVLKGNNITWINWQAAPYTIPAGTKLKVLRNGYMATFTREDNGESYNVDLGANGDAYLEKFVTRKPVNLNRFTDDVKSSISKGIAKIGMTKEQVYIAMGAPSTLSAGRTEKMTLEEIMKADRWIYSRRRFGKNIGVEFDPSTGKVTRTEGIWGKD